MIEAKTLFIEQRHITAGVELVKDVEGFDTVSYPVALRAGKLLMPGLRLKSIAVAEYLMIDPVVRKELGARLVGYHTDTDESEKLATPVVDPDSATIWREITVLPEEVWQRLELLNV